MADFFLDFENGNDANDGTTFANRWKTLTSGATAARIAAGDTIRVMGSPLPTLIDNSGKWTSVTNNTGVGTTIGTMTGATNATPIVVTRNAHGLANGDIVRITGAAGNTAANGVWEVANQTANTFELKDSTGNGTWTSGGAIVRINMQVVTIPAALVKVIDNGEAVWTAANSAGAALSPSSFKEFLNSSQITLPASPATGTLYGYKALAGATDFSAFQQVTLWIRVSSATSAGHLKLCLCSDNAGATPVDTIALPAITSAVRWVPITIDTAGALGASIQSVALYSDTVAPPGNLVVRLDNILAAKASSGADAVTLTSLIGKACARRLSISSSTNATPIVVTVTGHGYHNGDTVYIQDHATNTNANGVFRVANVAANTFELVDLVSQENVAGNGTGGATGTVVGDETWWPIANITVNSTTTIIMIDAECGADGYLTRGYVGTSETVATYKRETIKFSMVASGASHQTLQDSGSSGSPITISGGWDRTDMSTRDRDTWIDGQSGFGTAINNGSRTLWAMDRLHTTRFQTAVNPLLGWQIGYMCCTAHNGTVITFNQADLVVDMLIIAAGNGGTTTSGLISGLIRYIAGLSLYNTGLLALASAVNSKFYRVVGRNMGTRAITDSTAENYIYSVYADYNLGTLNFNSTLSNVMNVGRIESSDATVFNDTSAATRSEAEFRYWYNGLNADSHGRRKNGAHLSAETTVRHTASGYAWKLSVSSTQWNSTYPAKFRVAQIPCNANQLVTFKAWLRRDNTGLSMRLIAPGKQLPGVPNDVTADITAAADTWEEVTLTFTPTTAGVVDVFLYGWGGTTFLGYIDDITITVGGTAIDLPTMDWQYWGQPFVTYKPASTGGGPVGTNLRGGFSN